MGKVLIVSSGVATIVFSGCGGGATTVAPTPAPTTAPAFCTLPESVTAVQCLAQLDGCAQVESSATAPKCVLKPKDKASCEEVCQTYKDAIAFIDDAAWDKCKTEDTENLTKKFLDDKK